MGSIFGTILSQASKEVIPCPSSASNLGLLGPPLHLPGLIMGFTFGPILNQASKGLLLAGPWGSPCPPSASNLGVMGLPSNSQGS